MTISWKFIREQLKSILILVAVGFVVTSAIYYDRPLNRFLLIGSFSASVWVFLWKGNEYISEWVWRRASWLKSPLRTFIIGFSATIIYSLGIVYLLIRTFEWIFNASFGDVSATLYSTVISTVVITFFMNGRAFLNNWKKAALDAEVLKRENVTARYESLKNQVNPHFLFNNLNALTNLVYEDQDKAAQFIKQLSEVYRYVLDTRDKEVVPLEEELKFLKSYLFLQQIRSGDKLKVEIDLNGLQTHVAPLVLQMLVENAVKHNIVSEESPLTIQIGHDTDFIIVKNNLQRRSVIETSPGIGLENIRSRYEFLSDKKVEVTKTSEEFVVKVPLIREVT